MCYLTYERQDTANGILGVGSARSTVEAITPIKGAL